MATLYVRDDIIWIRFSDNGKQILKSTKLRDTKEGWIKANKLKMQIANDIHRNLWSFNVSKKKRIKFSQAIKLFYKAKFNDEDYKYGGTYQSSFSVFLDQIGDIFINQISNSDLQKFKEYLLTNNAHATAVTYINMLRTMYNFLIKESYYTKQNPITKLKAIPKIIRTIPDPLFKSIENYIKPRNEQGYRYIKLLYLTGLRVSEAINLQWTDIDFSNNILYVTNTKAKRIDSFPLYPELKEFLLSFRKESGKLFEYKGRNSLKFWNRARKRLKHTYTLHDIRRTFGTRLSKKLMPYELMKVMRHADIKVTMRHYIGTDMQSIIDKM